jgi:hypothetical protein
VSHREYCIWLQIMLVHSSPSWYQEAEKHVVGVLQTHGVWTCLTDEDFHRVIEMLQAPNLKGSSARTQTEEEIVHHAHELATDRFGCRVLNAALKLLSIQEGPCPHPNQKSGRGKEYSDLQQVLKAYEDINKNKTKKRRSLPAYHAIAAADHFPRRQKRKQVKTVRKQAHWSPQRSPEAPRGYGLPLR